jgi:hypothetical protein
MPFSEQRNVEINTRLKENIKKYNNPIEPDKATQYDL